MLPPEPLLIVPFSPDRAGEAAAVVRRAIAACWRADFSAAYVAVCLERLTAAELLRDADRRCALVALRAGRVAGYAALEGPWLRGVFTDPDQQRRGVGRALVRRLVEKAAGDGLAQLRLHAAPGAVAFYEALGFRRKAEVEREYGRLTLMVKAPGEDVG